MSLDKKSAIELADARWLIQQVQLNLTPFLPDPDSKRTIVIEQAVMSASTDLARALELIESVTAREILGLG